MLKKSNRADKLSKREHRSEKFCHLKFKCVLKRVVTSLEMKRTFVVVDLGDFILDVGDRLLDELVVSEPQSFGDVQMNDVDLQHERRLLLLAVVTHLVIQRVYNVSEALEFQKVSSELKIFAGYPLTLQK